MNILDIIDKITQAILHFDFEKFFKNSKLIVVLIAVIAMIIIIFGALFSLVPQF